MRGGDVAGRVQVRLNGGLREALVGSEAVGHEAQARVGLGGHEAGGQDARHAARVQHGAAAADVAQHGRRAHQVLARQQPAPACDTVHHVCTETLPFNSQRSRISFYS